MRHTTRNKHIQEIHARETNIIIQRHEERHASIRYKQRHEKQALLYRDTRNKYLHEIHHEIHRDIYRDTH